VAGVGDGHDVPVHVHTERLSRHVLGAVCACGAALDSALSTTGRGVVVHVRPRGTARACGLREADDPAAAAAAGEITASVLADLRVGSVPLLDADDVVRETVRSHGFGAGGRSRTRVPAG
jgi:3,4-dihydroxy 2-butanone 4-phosphate synthase/GTP cyclohydrolase II